MAYVTSDTTIIHHVYKPDSSTLRSYFLDRKLGPICHQIGGRVRSRFLLGQCPGHLHRSMDSSIMHVMSTLATNGHYEVHMLI